MLVVANFPRKQIGPRMSDCLMTGVQTNCQDVEARRDSTVLVACSHAVEPGTLNGEQHNRRLLTAYTAKSAESRRLPHSVLKIHITFECDECISAAVCSVKVSLHQAASDDAACQPLCINLCDFAALVASIWPSRQACLARQDLCHTHPAICARTPSNMC